MEAAGREALAQGRLDTLRRWLEGLDALETPPTPELLLLRGEYCQRTGDREGALELAEEVIRRYPGQAGERCALEAGLLRARLLWETDSAARSLAAVEEILPRLGPDRAALAPLRRQAVQLRMYSLLELGQNARALELALEDMEESGSRGDGESQLRSREMAVIAAFAMGDYRRAIPMYVVVRGGGGGAMAAPCHHLYLAVSGRAGQALCRINRVLEELPEGLSRRELEQLLLVQTLIGQIAALTGGPEACGETGKGFWESAAVQESLGGREPGGLTHTLRRALGDQPLAPGEEDALFALGGGVTGDMGGLAAALYLRGIPCVQLPTSLLSAVDSSVGGKTAVDLPEGKNLVGTFTQPHLVLCDTDALSTLPSAVLAEGWAEVVKYGMIRSPQLLSALAEGRAQEDLEWVVAHCVSIKRDVVACDERDTGERQLLNFGHTIGHAIERCGGYSIYHGEGVAMGMAIMTRACVRQGKCPAECWTVLERLLDKYHLPKRCDVAPERLLEAARADKKRRGEAITLIQPREPGECVLFRTDYGELARVLELGM